MKILLAVALAAFATPALAQEAPAEPPAAEPAAQPTLQENAKQLGGQLVMSLFDKLLNGKKTPPAAQPAEVAAVEQPAAEAQPAVEVQPADAPNP